VDGYTCYSYSASWALARMVGSRPGGQQTCNDVSGSNDESGLFRSYCATQLRSRVSSMFQKMAIWHMRGVAPFVTPLQAGVSQGAERKPLPAMLPTRSS
jgi:hypothetical protein